MVTKFRRTIDRKTKFYPTQKNTIGLMPGPPDVGGSCPGCTRGDGGCWCDSKGAPVCYASTCCRIYKASAVILENNQKAVSEGSVVENLLQMLSDFSRETFRYAKKKGIHPEDIQYFRWHWSGDLFNREYALEIARAIRLTPGIKHWIYTRSFEFAEILNGIPNVVVYLSLDPCNWESGVCTYFRDGLFEDPKRKLCFMAKTKDKVDAMLLEVQNHPDKYGRKDKVVEWANRTKISTCPVDDHKLPLEYGCSKCRQCISPGNQLLWFRS